MEKVIVIIGQTAVGKTSMSIKLAKHLHTQIINGDAMQVYKELNIVTDKIKNEKMEGIVHHLLNIKSINEDYSVEEYQTNIRKVIKDINNQGQIPIIVGGTGLYIKATLFDYNFAKESISNKEVEEIYKEKSNEELYDILLKLDPESANKIHMNNRRRVLRAIAIYNSTGIKKSEIIENQKHELLYDAIIIGLDMPKDIINSKIDKRIEEMFDEGLIDEIKNNKTTTTASKAIGYKEVSAYLNNEISLEEAKELMKIHTHQYAKRQRTFFKNQFDVNWVTNDENAFDNIVKIINEKWNI